MKKIFKLIGCAAMGTMLMTACSSDDVAPKGPEPAGDNDELYLTVDIRTAGAQSRANDPVANADESKVLTAHFYFYDENGAYFTDGVIWESSTGNDLTGTGKQKIVLRNLPSNKTPKYMVTVLNQPSDFKAGSNLSEMATKLTDIKSTAGNFVMTSSSFFVDNNDTDYEDKNTYPFASLLKEANFITDESSLSEANAVPVYVERLAAKVSFEKSGNDNPKRTINITIQDIENGTNKNIEGPFTVEFVRWGVNAFEKQSYLLKDILSVGEQTSREIKDSKDKGYSWTLDKWNSATDHRSYWGHSALNDVAALDGAANFVYMTSDQLQKAGTDNYSAELSKPIYTCEHTYKDAVTYNENTEDFVLQAPNVTSVVLLGQLKQLNSNEGQTFIKHYGQYFTIEGFKAHIYNGVTVRNSKKYYTSNDGTNFTELKMTELLLIPVPKPATDAHGQSSAEILFKANITTGNIYEVEKDKDANATNAVKLAYDAINKPNPTLPEQIEALEAILNKTLERDTQGDPAYMYRDGYMWFNIPIEHHKTQNTTNDYLYEGRYGVIRNHWYKISLNDSEMTLDDVGYPFNYNQDETYQGALYDYRLIPTEIGQKFSVGALVEMVDWYIVEQTHSLNQ